MAKKRIILIRFNLISLLIITVLLLFVACKKEVEVSGTPLPPAVIPTPTPTPTPSNNRAPIANAGLDQQITLPTDSAFVDGSRSSDPDGHKISFKWTQLSGPSISRIATSDSSKTWLNAFRAGVYFFQLTVTDSAGARGMDTVRISVDDITFNQPPTAIAGGDISITLPVNYTTLNGGLSTDPDGTIISFMWSQLSGPDQSLINNPSAVITRISNLQQGTYKFELSVRDNGGLSAKDTIQVFVGASTTIPCDNRPVINVQLTQVGLLSQGRRNLVSAAVGNKILFAGGQIPGAYTSRVDIFDVVANTWTTAELSVPERQGMAVATVGNKAFFAGGGDNDNGDLTSRVDIYNASTNTWSTAELSQARQNLTATTLGNKIFFAGGGIWGGAMQGSTVVDIYDNETDTWSTASLSEGRLDHSATVVGNKIYFAGGTKGLFTSLQVIASIDIFDASNNSWSTSMLQEPRMCMASAYTGTKLLYVGGHRIGYSLSDNAEIKDMNTGITLTTCIKPRSHLQAVVKDDKIIFFTGIYNGDGIHFEIYNKSNDQWSTGRINRRIHDATIVTLNNTVYVAGGMESGSAPFYNQVWKLEF